MYINESLRINQVTEVAWFIAPLRRRGEGGEAIRRRSRQDRKRRRKPSISTNTLDILVLDDTTVGQKG